MADKRFTPKALDKAQKDTLTVANTWAQNDTATLTINEKDLVLTVGASFATTDVATALEEMWNGDDFTVATHAASETGDNVPEFAEAAASVSGSVVTVLGNTKGVPFTLTAAENTAGTGTVTQATSIAATGVHFWDNIDNWGGSAIPADTDVVYLDHSDTDIKYGLAQGDIEPAAVYISMSFEGNIGLPEVNQDGDEYHEYRATYLRLGMAILQVGAGEGNGSGRIKIDSGDDICAVTVLNTGASADELPAFLWKGSNAGNTLTVLGGSVGVAVFGSETAVVATLVVREGDVTLGAGCTLTTITVYGGVVRVNSAIGGTLTVYGGTVVIDGTGAVAGLVIYGGTVVYNTSGTLGGATTVSGDGVLDFSQDPRAKTITNPVDIFGRDCRVIDNNKAVTGGSNLIVDCNQGSDPSQIEFGPNVRVTRGNVA